MCKFKVWLNVDHIPHLQELKPTPIFSYATSPQTPLCWHSPCNLADCSTIAVCELSSWNAQFSKTRTPRPVLSGQCTRWRDLERQKENRHSFNWETNNKEISVWYSVGLTLTDRGLYVEVWHEEWVDVDPEIERHLRGSQTDVLGI